MPSPLAAFSIASRALSSSSVATMQRAAAVRRRASSDETKKPASSPSHGSTSSANERPVSDSLKACSSSLRMRSPALPSPGNFSIRASIAGLLVVARVERRLAVDERARRAPARPAPEEAAPSVAAAGCDGDRGEQGGDGEENSKHRASYRREIGRRFSPAG